MGSVRIFRKSGIGLDYYKGKEFMSRVVQELEISIEQLVQKNLMTFLLQEDLEQDQMEDHFRLKNLKIVLMKCRMENLLFVLSVEEKIVLLLFQWHGKKEKLKV